MRKLAVLLLFILLLTACTPAPPVETTAPTTEPAEASTAPTESTIAPVENTEFSRQKSYIYMTEDREELSGVMEVFLPAREAFYCTGEEPTQWNGTDFLISQWHITKDVLACWKTFREELDNLGIRVISSELYLPSNTEFKGGDVFHSFCLMETLTYEQGGQTFTIDIHHYIGMGRYEEADWNIFVYHDQFVCPFTGMDTGPNHSNCGIPDQHSLYPEPQPVPVEP